MFYVDMRILINKALKHVSIRSDRIQYSYKNKFPTLTDFGSIKVTKSIAKYPMMPLDLQASAIL